MTPNQLEAFLAIVRLESISEAARYLYISQSTISHRLQNLEEEYKVTLIERGRGVTGISLTEEGEKLYNIALRWEDLSIQAKDIKNDASSTTIVIGAVDSVHNYLFYSVYEKIRKEYPQIKIVIRTHQSNEIYSLLQHREIDIGFPLQERMSSKFKVTKMFEEKMVLIKKKRDGDVPKIIKNNHLHINDEIYVNWGQEFQAWHEKHWGFFGTQAIQVDTVELLYKLMGSNHWAIVPKSVADSLQLENKVDIYELEDNPPSRTCYYVHRKNQSEKIKLFGQLLQELF